MNSLLRYPVTHRRPSDVLSDALRSFAERKRKVAKKSVRFPMDVVLKECVVDGDLIELASLVEKHGDGIVNQLDSVGMPLAVRAVVEDQFEVLQFLVKKGVDLTLSDPEGWTPLHAAVGCGDVRTVKYILKAGKGANLTNFETVHGLRPIDLSETIEMAQALHKADSTAFRKELHRFVSQKPEERSPKGLVQLCATKDEAFLITEMVSRSRKEVQRFLKQKEASLGHSLLHVAAGKNFPNLAILLLDTHLVEVDCKDRNGWIPLHTAAYYNNVDLVLLLKEYGSNTDARDLEGLTPDLMTEDPLVADILCDIVL